MKILNLYAGIGGNRKLWGDEHQVTAVEHNANIAAIYSDLFPNDTMIVGDAHEYLLKHHQEFDFIWSSPPCPTHSRINTLIVNNGTIPARYPDMKLYEEIIFLKHWYKGKYCVENVRSYYTPLIAPLEVQSHYFWANFAILDTGRNREKVVNQKGQSLKVKMERQGIDISDWHGYKGDKRTLINNMVEPSLGKHILDNLLNPIELQGALL